MMIAGDLRLQKQDLYIDLHLLGYDDISVFKQDEFALIPMFAFESRSFATH